MSARWTNAAEVARLAGLSRERLSQLLAQDKFPGAVRVAIGERTFWRIPIKSAERFLKERGVKVNGWHLPDPHATAISKAQAAAVWVAD